MEVETTHTLDLSDRLYKIAIGALVIAVLFMLGTLLYEFRSLPQNMPHEIMVSGEGKAFAKPDVATVSFGATTQNVKSQDAVTRNNQIMNNVIAAVKALGVEDKDIQTTSYNLSPWYDYTSGGSVFRGYQLQQQVSVKIRNFDNISKILDAATSKGATNVGDLQFNIDDPEKVSAQARDMAIQKAKEKLDNMLRQSGLKVGKLVNISEGSNNNYPEPMYAMGFGGKDIANALPSVQSGQQEIVSTITLTYQVK